MTMKDLKKKKKGLKSVPFTCRAATVALLVIIVSLCEHES